MRVMSRSEPPAACSGSCPSTRVAPAWLRRTFASACGRWLVTATSRSCAPASIATGRAPSDVTKPCTVRSSSGPVPAVGVRNQVAPSNSSAFARSGPRVSAPQIGWPPTKRPSPAAAAQTALFVEPTSVTTAPGGASSSTSRTACGSSATGAATSTRSAPVDGVREGRGGLDRLALLGDAEHVGVGVPAAHGDAARGARRAPRTRRSGPSRRRSSCAASASPYPRISSATRNARSSDWRAFRRGSQSDS